jgi:hypothetical protein
MIKLIGSYFVLDGIKGTYQGNNNDNNDIWVNIWNFWVQDDVLYLEVLMSEQLVVYMRYTTSWSDLALPSCTKR